MQKNKKFLWTHNLCKFFGDLKAVDHVTIQVKKGERLGIIGPNGAGKTTFFNLITSLNKTTKGSVYFKGKNITKKSPAEIARMGITRAFQVPKPFKSLTVFENILAACGKDVYSGASFFKRFRTEKNIEKTQKLIQKVGLQKYSKRSAKELPIGYMRRLEIARALAMDPELILLDEIASGMSYEEYQGIMKLIRNLNEEGLTFMLVEHNMDFAMELSERLYVLNFGKVISEGTPAEIRNDEKVLEVYLGGGENA